MTTITSRQAVSPHRRHLLRAGWGLGLGLATGALPARPPAAPTSPDVALSWRETALPAFGTTVWLRAAHRDGAHAAAALGAAARRIQDVESQMSLYRDDSALVRLNRDGRLDDAPDDLLAVVRESLRVARATRGLFDPTVQPLWRAHFDAARDGRRLDAQTTDRLRTLVDWRGVHIDEPHEARHEARHDGQRDSRRDGRRPTIAFARSGMALTLNGIAQGWATDAATKALRDHGIEHALIDAGEWQPLGHASDGGPWRLGVQDPRDARRIVATIASDGRAVACSADDKLAFTPDRREHHVLDPRTGRSPRELSCVVVLAPTATLADALSKPAMMGSARDALVLARRWRVDVIAVDKYARVTSSLDARRAPQDVRRA